MQAVPANNLVRFLPAIVGLGMWTAPTEPLHRTQEVGGSNPPSSIESNALQTRAFAFRPLV
jgi:hypothetical protein